MPERIRITRIARPVSSSLAAAKRSPSKSSRTKALTSRAPEMFSWRIVLRRSRRRWTEPKRGSIRTMKKTMTAEVRTRTGSMTRASRGLVRTIRIRLPSIRRGARVPILSEIMTTRWTALVSLVRRTRSEPVFRASRSAKEKVWIRVKRASRRSRAPPSAAGTDRRLFPTARRALTRRSRSSRGPFRGPFPGRPGDPLVDDPLDQPGDGRSMQTRAVRRSKAGRRASVGLMKRARLRIGAMVVHTSAGPGLSRCLVIVPITASGTAGRRHQPAGFCFLLLSSYIRASALLMSDSRVAWSPFR